MSFSTMAMILMALKLALTAHWARRELCAVGDGSKLDFLPEQN
jgi:hypothetical protein